MHRGNWNGNPNCLFSAKARRRRLVLCYRPLTVGRRPETARNGPFFVRVCDSAGKYQWVRHETQQAAEKAAKAAPVARKAQVLGLTVDDLTNGANTDRISIKTAPSKTICKTESSVTRDRLPLTRTRSTNCWRTYPVASDSSISWRHPGLSTSGTCLLRTRPFESLGKLASRGFSRGDSVVLLRRETVPESTEDVTPHKIP